MNFYCAGNWKMNMNAEAAATYVCQLLAQAPKAEAQQLLIFPPALIAWQVAELLKGSAISWGAQNCFGAEQGAFTGENSPRVLLDMGARFTLIGHSERRQIFAEPDTLLAQKLEGIQRIGLTPILCVGETLDDRRWNRTREVIVRQLRTAMKNADPKKPLWIAYEPVWAIGTGEVASPLQVEEAHEILRKALAEWNSAVAERTPILYGGSVKPDNAASLANLRNVNGFLIGGASLNVTEFLAIQANAQSARG